jgi:hypothetical protein
VGNCDDYLILKFSSNYVVHEIFCLAINAMNMNCLCSNLNDEQGSGLKEAQSSILKEQDEAERTASGIALRTEDIVGTCRTTARSSHRQATVKLEDRVLPREVVKLFYHCRIKTR